MDGKLDDDLSTHFGTQPAESIFPERISIFL